MLFCSFFSTFGQMMPVQLSISLLISCILIIICCLIVSNIVITGYNLASTIHLLKVSEMLLSTESQQLPNLNQALLQCCGSVFITSLAPSGVHCANLALARLNNIVQGAFAQAQNSFCQSFSLYFFLQLAYMCLAQFLCSAIGAQW